MDKFVKSLAATAVMQTERVASFFAMRGLIVDSTMAQRAVEVVWLMPLIPSIILLESMVAMMCSYDQRIANLKLARSTPAHRAQLRSMGLTLSGLKACISDEQALFMQQVLKGEQSEQFKATRQWHVTRNETLRGMDKEIEIVKELPQASQEALIEGWYAEVKKGVLATNTVGSLMRTYLHQEGHSCPDAETLGVIYYAGAHSDDFLPSETETVARLWATHESGFN